LALSRCRCQLRDTLDDVRTLKRLPNELVGLLGLSIGGQCTDRLEQLLLQVIQILLFFLIMIVIIVFSLDLLLKLQLIKGNDDHLLLLYPKLGMQEVHRLPELPIVLNNLLLLFVGVLVTFLAEGVE